jgi:nucleotide-binding universal stress UspA family protein
MKLLIAVDDSKWSQAAVDFVKLMTWPSPTEIVVLAANPPFAEQYAGFPDAIPFFAPGLVAEAQQRSAATAERYAQQLRETCERVRAEAVTDDPRSAIVAAAMREAADLIVVGSHGRSGLQRLLLGSVSHYVVNHAPCNVLVVKLPQ